MKALYIIGILILLLIGFFFIFSNSSDEIVTKGIDPNAGYELIKEKGSTKTPISDSIWRTIELKDIKTGEIFTINKFDKPILLESFAVWCPTCTRQQNEIKKLHEDIGNKVVSISLDTDPNEDEEKVLEHINSNGFDWYYAISPKELTKSLIDEFGISVANAPSAPIILIDENKNARLLPSGVKKVDELKEELKL